MTASTVEERGACQAWRGSAGMSATALDIDWVSLPVMDPPPPEWASGSAAGLGA